MCYEHSPSEGLAPVQLLENLLKKIDGMQQVEEGISHDHLPPPEKLEWKIDNDIKRRINVACAQTDK